MACTDDTPGDEMMDTEGTGDGDGDPSGDGDGDPSGDGDGDPSGDGDGDPSGDGDGDPSGDGDGDPSGDGDGDPSGECGDGNVDANEECDDGNADNTDDCLATCVMAMCGDGYVWAGNEDCDDGNAQSSDGCESDCSVSVGAMKVATGGRHSCALLWDGQIRCWGDNFFGQLGLGHTDDIGDDEPASAADFVDIGGTAVDIAASRYHTCAVRDDASVLCWGYNAYGQLGYGSTTDIGDNESPVNMGPVDVGDDVLALALGLFHTCALTDQQTVRCWGLNGGALGLGHTAIIGDDEFPASSGPAEVGDDVVAVTAGAGHTCVLLASGDVRCFGGGNLGLGHSNAIGDDELPSSVPVVSLGDTPILNLATGTSHSCVLYDDATMRCWGSNNDGQLGYGNTEDVGDDELPSSLPTVDVGADVDEIWVGGRLTCIRAGSDVKCWGNGFDGAHGYGSFQNLGDDELPSSFGMVDVGFDVTSLAEAGMSGHVCAQSGADLRCWGHNNSGQLGYGHWNNIGDNELPSSEGLVPYYQ